MFSMQSVSKNPLIATFQLSSAASLNMGQSQNVVSWNGLNRIYVSCLNNSFALCRSNFFAVFVAFVEDNATMISIRYFENHVSYFVQDRRK